MCIDLEKILKKMAKNNKLILKLQKRFKSQKHNVFTEVNNCAL